MKAILVRSIVIGAVLWRKQFIDVNCYIGDSVTIGVINEMYVLLT